MPQYTKIYLHTGFFRKLSRKIPNLVECAKGLSRVQDKQSTIQVCKVIFDQCHMYTSQIYKITVLLFVLKVQYLLQNDNHFAKRYILIQEVLNHFDKM